MSDWEVVPDAPQAKAAPSSDWEVVPNAPAEASEAPKDERGFFAKAYDSVVSGAHAVKHVGSDLIHHPLDTLADPAKRHELERGVGDVVTLGYGNKLAARVGNALGDVERGTSLNETKHFSSSPTAGDTHEASAVEASDAAAAPDYRTTGQILGSALPGPANALGAVGAPVARAVAPKIFDAAAKVAAKAAAVPILGEAAKGVAGYEATAPALAALSADAEGHRHQAAHDAAFDPAALVVTAGLGAARSGAHETTAMAKRALEHAPESEAANLMAGVAAGDGQHGRATVKAAKLLSKTQDEAVDVLRNDKQLREVSDKPAKQALPVFHERLNQTGSKLDPHYDVVDKATGGVSVLNLANVLDDETQRLGQSPLNEQYMHAVQDIKRSALKAWAPSLEEKLAAQKRLQDMGLQSHTDIPDVMIPTRKVREMVTRLQSRGTQVINALNPGESSQMKADMASMMKNFIDSHLEVAAETSPEVAKSVNEIRDLNRQYSALARMTEAVEQRKWKEETGATSAGGHVGNLLKHGGAVAAVPMLMHGNVPGAVATIAAPHALPMVAAAGRGITSAASSAVRSPGYQDAVARLAKAARGATNVTEFVNQAVRAGLPIADARRIAEAGQRARQQGGSP